MVVDTQFSIFLVDKPGVLATITTALAKAKVNLVALTLVDSMEHGVLRIVTDNAEKTRKVLGKAHDRWTETDVVLLELADKPGAFAHVTTELAKAHINISYAYCTGGAKYGRTTAVFKLADMKKAQKILDAGKKDSKNPHKEVKPPPSRKR